MSEPVAVTEPVAVVPSNDRDMSVLPDWAKADLERTERLAAEVKATRKEAAGYRTRLREFESAEETAKKQAEANAPLEERLSAAEKAKSDALARLEAIGQKAEAEKAFEGLSTTLREAGVNKDYLGDATDLLSRHLEKLSDEQVDSFDLDKWLETRAYLMGGAATTSPAVVRLGSARNNDTQPITAASLKSMSQAEYEKNRTAILQGVRQTPL